MPVSFQIYKRGQKIEASVGEVCGIEEYTHKNYETWKEEHDVKHLVLLNLDPQEMSSKLGTGEGYLFLFKAVGEGNTYVDTFYRNSREKEPSDSRRYDVTIKP